MANTPHLSQHPTDRLIRELLQTKREVSEREIQEITERLATAPFNRALVPVRKEHRGIPHGNYRIGDLEDSLTYHLALRVVVDGQWAHGTSTYAYLADLRQAARDSSASLALYQRRGGAIAGVLAPNRIPKDHLGRTPLPWIYVVYSADRGMLVSGYQVSAKEEVRVPESARWLK